MEGEERTYIFLDESGKPEVYSVKGVNLVEANQATKYLVIAAVRTSDQLALQQQVTEFRLSLLRDKSLKAIFSPSYGLDSFHANPDYKIVREKFYEFIASLDVKIDVIVVEKLKCYDALKRNPGRLYGVMAGQLIRDQMHQNHTEVIFSRKDSKLKLRQELELEVERQRMEYLEKHPNLESTVELKYMHNPHYSHGGLQVADYVAFAVFQVFEKNKREYYDLIKNKIGRIHDICNRKYFTKRNPL